MRFIFAFKAEPLQLRFINWVLDRKDIDKNAMMEAIRNKDDSIVNAISDFSSFQSEVKTQGSKLPDSSNIFYDCIYEQCANDDDSFKYVFGDDNNKNRYINHYKHALNEIYDAFKNSMEFSKEGDFTQRSKAVFDGFKKKNTSLDKLVKEMDSILAENNQNSEKDDANFSKTFDEAEDESWKTLEENEVYSKGKWHIYQVDKYEDLRNVASKCSEWCVARAESGRSYFYNTYNPPYYLFCKGRRNPYILMHIGSHQFKGLDDYVFRADRPSSYEAIEIGREFLESTGKDIEYYNDFEVFSDENSIGVGFDSSTIVQYLSGEEAREMSKETENLEVLKKICSDSTDSKAIANAIDRLPNIELKSVIPKIEFDDVIIDNSIDDVMELFGKIHDKCIPIKECHAKCCKFFETILTNTTDLDKLDSFVQKYNGIKYIETTFLGKSLSYISFTASFIKYLVKKGMRDAIKKILGYGMNNEEVLKEIVRNYHDDTEIMNALFNSSGGLDVNILRMVGEYSKNDEIFSKIVPFINAKLVPLDGSVVCNIVKNTKNMALKRNMYKKVQSYSRNDLFDENQTFEMFRGAENIDERIAVLEKTKSPKAVNTVFDNCMQADFGNMDENDRLKLCKVFSNSLADEKRLHQLFEKTGYDYRIVFKCNKYVVDVKDLIHAIDVMPPLEQCANSLSVSSDVVYMFINESKWTYSDSESRKAMLKYLQKNSNDEASFNSIINALFKGMSDVGFARTLIVDYHLFKSLKKGNGSYAVQQFLEDFRNKIISDEDFVVTIANECDAEMISNLFLFFNLCKSKKAYDILTGRLENDSKQNYLLLKFKCKKLEEGMMDDEEAREFIKSYLEKNNYEFENCFGIMSLSNHNNSIFEYTCDLILKGMKNGPVLDEMVKDIFGFAMEHDCIVPKQVIDYCSGKGYLGEAVITCKDSNEEQLRDAFDLMLKEKISIINTDVEQMPSKAIKILNEYKEEGKIDKINYRYIASNKNATSEDLLDILENNEDWRFDLTLIDKILDNPNCTKEVADSIIDSLDSFEIKRIFERNIALFNRMTKWKGAEMLLLDNKKDEDSENRILYEEDDMGEDVDCDELSYIVRVANAVRSKSEIEKVFEYASNLKAIRNNPKRSLRSNTWAGKDNMLNVIRALVMNIHCTVGFFEKMISSYPENIQAEALYEFVLNHEDYDYTESNDLTTEEIDYVITRFRHILDINKRIVDIIASFSKNMNGEQAMFFIKNYAVELDAKVRHETSRILDLKGITEDMLLELLDSVVSDEDVADIARSKNAGEAVYRKVVDMNAGTSSISEVIKRTQDDELKHRASRTVSQPIEERINNETDAGKLKELMTRVFRSWSRAKEVGNSLKISKITNPQALEMMSKVKSKEVINALIGNNYIKPEIVLSLLKKNPTKENFKVASYSKDKNVLLYVCCMTHSEDIIDRVFTKRENIQKFTSDDIMRMLKWNPSCKYDILIKTYFKLDDEQLISLKKLKDMDVDWIVENVLKRRRPNTKTVAGRVVDRLLKASRIIRNIVFD